MDEHSSVETGASPSVKESALHDGIATDQYAEVLRRHGRTDLVPMPSDSPADPLNWSSWRKGILLAIVSMHAMMVVFSAAILVPAFEDLVTEFGVTLAQVPYVVSIQILFMGIAPIFWTPLSERIGRRPVYLISALFSAAFALGGAFAKSWGALMTTRVFQVIFISPAFSIGALSVQETSFTFERGRKMGVWVLMVTCGPLVGPLVSGYLVQFKGWRASLYLVSALQLFLFFAHFFLAPETLFPNRAAPGEAFDTEEVTHRSGWQSLLRFRMYSRKPYQATEFFRFLVMFGRPVVVLATLAYSIVFTYTVVLMPIFIPQLVGVTFRLTPGQMSLQFIGLLIGAVLGELLAGPGSDLYVNWRARQRLAAPAQPDGDASAVIKVALWPEDRLIPAAPGFILVIVGLIIWGAQLQNATPGKWNVTPIVGATIAMFGNQFASTMCVTYAIESYRSETKDVSVFISFVRQIYGFIAPFYLSVAYTNMGDLPASALWAGLTAFAMLLTLACIFWGPAWRQSA
ncbi:MFS general substrate transporter [Coniophora puteana RWD-64-598 SS2]|uniref:MFS general substrate transporter n=1 Tax=Coniophora puteana (strain RWD-64-598) TaxID=741705 RepID=A0A5M3MZF4_CONPW|nr:MFS general substrate transporter [Coniophora puteana RWD-64-598 SS2]EIW84530.1 MFS general substrate transporter [Coniophora puteana RWD-64-598 SS2]